MAAPATPPPEPESRRASGLDEDSLFDAYAELAVRGDAPPPEAFLAAHPGASAELRASLARMFQRAPRGASKDGGLPFERLGEFRLVRRLGGGGMGIVFLAVQESLGREVALKILRPELQGSAVAAERFRREARALAELRHENLVTIFGGGEEHGVRYLAMELVPGATLDEILRGEGESAGDLVKTSPPPYDRSERRGASLARRVRWVAGVARGLQHAHERGVVHRDVKPANVRITPDDRARLLDFGLARRDEGRDASVTESFAGSPSYAAPEQIQEGGAIDARTDVYALGVTLYQCLTGRLPFEGATVEQVFHRILAGTPPPPRKLAPGLPRDLELVTLKAMARRPEQRYATAAAFADDLEAVLELRPVSARPPGPLERARRAVRAHPLLATAGATALAAGLVLLAIVTFQHDARERARLREAARLVGAARERVDDYRARRESLSAVQAEVAGLQEQILAQHFSEAQYALLDRHEAQLEDEQRAWEQTYYEVLDLLRQAERLDPQVQGTEAVRGELYLARYREATDRRHPLEADFFRELAARSDPRLAGELAGEMRVEVSSDPPGADVFVFRFHEQSRLRPGGEPRMVAAPIQDQPPAAPPGTWALRVLRDCPPLLRGDHVFEIEGAPIEGSVFVVDGGELLGAGERLVAVDGAPIRDDWDVAQLRTAAPDGVRRFEFEHRGSRSTLEARSLDDLGVVVAAAGRFGRAADREPVSCRLVRDGRWLELELPPAAPVRATARPALTSPACRGGATPAVLSVPSGAYLLVLRLAGREEVRVAHSVDGNVALRVTLPALGSGPAGFVFVPGADEKSPGDFWIQEREVTCEEWREFLRHPETRRQLAASGWSRLVPRMTGQAQPYWSRDGDGSWTWPSSWAADFPIVGLSFDDARDYVAWRNRRAQESEEPFVFALPSDVEMWRGAVGTLIWPYVYGNRLRPRWSRCCFSRPHANIGPVLEFPVDESPYGAFDLTGGALEWLDHWYDEPRRMRMLAGGGWGQARPEHLRLATGMGLVPEVSTGETGLRLVARAREGAEASR